ncbi:MAG TPA: helix-turn-helix transcriptional regulator [Solirubrobacteraceae bacterium]|nr:helix-turn-helix transcriptional regulator [Solirubrobacteraceae bacterium]
MHNETTLVEALRVDRGLTVEHVAHVTGVSPKTIKRYETAETTRPSGDALERLARFYGVRASVLLDDIRTFARRWNRADDATTVAA